MNKKGVALIAIIVMILVVICCCCLLITGAAVLWMAPVQGVNALTETAPVKTPIQLPYVTRQAPESMTATPSAQVPSEGSGDLLPAKVSAEMEKIESQVMELRGIRLQGEITRKLMTTEQLNEQVMGDFFADYDEEENRRDTIILNLFGLLEKDYDLNAMFVDLYSEQIAGYYDNETKEMVVVADDAFGGPHRMTYAHEFTHALQDQAYDLRDGLGLDDQNCQLDSEYCAAVQALVEGDATLTETLWFAKYSTFKDKKEVFQYYNSYESPVYDTTPLFLQSDFLFPYDKGLNFVQTLYDQGGMAAVDQAYGSPPVSTEQILHPERYPQDVPLKIEIADLDDILGSEWQKIDDNTLGEWYTYLLLSQSYEANWNVAVDAAEMASEGWGGDRYVVYNNPTTDENVLVFRSQWDTDADATQFWDEFVTYGSQRWGSPEPDQSDYLRWDSAESIVVVARYEDQILWMMAPDMKLLQEIWRQFPLFISG